MTIQYGGRQNRVGSRACLGRSVLFLYSSFEPSSLADDGRPVIVGGGGGHSTWAGAR